jgi:hypothetical protein
MRADFPGDPAIRRLWRAMVISSVLVMVFLPEAFGQSRLEPCPSNPDAFWTDCVGTRIFPNGNKYVGEYRNGKRNGQFTVTYSNGSTYVGEFRDDSKSGQGTETFPNGEKYIGEYRDDKRNGQGMEILPTGEKYVGQFRDDKRNGQFTVTYPDGATYVGEFRDDRKSGQGTEIFRNGEKYVGEYSDGKRNGPGTQTFPTGEKYVGQFRDDRRNGQFTLTYSNGTKYVGEFRDDKRNGQGTQTFPSGEKYVGEYRDDKRNGQGTQTFPNGEKYVGEYRDDKRNGQGTQTFSSGEKYVGEFRDDKRSGFGTFTWPNGSVKRGIWENDEFRTAAKIPPPQRKENAALRNDAAGSEQRVETPPPQRNESTGPRNDGAGSLRRVALIISNSNYLAQVPLANPKNDADLIASALRTAGFQSVTVKNDLSREQMLRAIQDFATIADSSDWSVVYYSGHGMAFNGINYMVPVDARLKADRDIDIEAVDVGKLSNAISGARKLHLIILDMCRSNPFLKTMTRSIASRAIGRGLAPPVEAEAGEYTVFAARDGQEALDGDGANSPFAEALAKRLQLPNIDVRRVFDYVREDVLTATGHRQQPFTYGSLPPMDFYFVQK